MQRSAESSGSNLPGVHVWRISYWAAAVIALGFLARIYLWTFNPIINPDGFLYIQQAKALYFGLSEKVLDCYHYLSPYPLFIAMLYNLLGNWVAAAQWINIFFGTLTLIPLYWLLKRFFGDSTVCASIMVFSLLPAYVLVSRDVLRGPTFWFFAVSGLYLFILHMEKRQRCLLFLSSLCFAVGAWSRIEGSLFIIVSAVFLLFINPGHRRKDLTVFLAPYIALALAGILLANLKGIDLAELLKPERLLSRPMEFISRYNQLRLELKSLYSTDLVSSAPYFFPRVRNLVWLIALGTLVVQMAETLLYLFCILIAIGWFSWIAHLKTNRRITYLWTLSLLAFILLYSQIIYNWAMASRFLAVFFFPAAVFMSFGIERMTHFMGSRFRLHETSVNVMMCLIVLTLLLPKTLLAHFDHSKLVFRQIAAHIDEREHHTRPVSVCGAFKYVQDIYFFTNLNLAGAPCFKGNAILNRTDAIGLKGVVNQDFDYLVWDQKNWNDAAIEITAGDAARHFHRLHEWSTRRYGKIVLYEVVK